MRFQKEHTKMNTMKNALTPLFQISLAFITGLLVSLPLGIFSFALLLAVPASIILFFCQKGRINIALQHGFQASVLVAVLGIGACMGWLSAQLPGNHVSHAIGQTVTLEGVTSEGSVATAKGQRLLLECEGDFVGKVLVYLPAAHPAIPHHSRIRVKAQAKELPARNAGYARYLRTQGILATAQGKQVEVLGQLDGLAYQLTAFRIWLAAQLTANMPEARMAGFAVAMFIGDRQGLDAELRASFSATGLSHILSISGMHVALFYLFLNYMLGFMGRTLALRHTRTAIILLALLGYLAITGFSPAVCRSVFMLSMLRLSELFFVQKNTLNILALSALLFLLIDPQLVHDLGFQLSYLAVAGILLLEPKFSQVIAERLPWLPRSIAGSIAMTLAAQLVTTPLILAHFGQFPAYFLVSNLLLLPIVSLATYLGIAALLLCWVPFVGELLGGVLDTVLFLVAYASDLIAALPGAVAHDASFSDPGFCVTVLMLAGLGGLVFNRDLYLAACRIYQVRFTFKQLAATAGGLLLGGFLFF
jgi:ComEC/Rec2-related protein